MKKSECKKKLSGSTVFLASLLTPKQSGLSETEKKKLIEEGKAQALGAIQKKIKDV